MNATEQLNPNGLGTIGVADALRDFLAKRFPDFHVVRSYLGIDSADGSNADAAGKSARILVIPDSFALDPKSRGRLARQVVCRIVLVKDFEISTTAETTFAPPGEVDPLVRTLDEIAQLFTEETRILETADGASDVYCPEARIVSDVGLYDVDQLAKGRFLAGIEVAIFETIQRKLETEENVG